MLVPFQLVGSLVCHYMDANGKFLLSWRRSLLVLHTSFPILVIYDHPVVVSCLRPCSCFRCHSRQMGSGWKVQERKLSILWITSLQMDFNDGCTCFYQWGSGRN